MDGPLHAQEKNAAIFSLRCFRSGVGESNRNRSSATRSRSPFRKARQRVLSQGETGRRAGGLHRLGCRSYPRTHGCFQQKISRDQYFLLAGNAIGSHDPDLDRIPGESVDCRCDRDRSASGPSRGRRNGTLPNCAGIVALDDPMRAGPLSSMLAACKDEWKDDVRWANFIRGLKSLNVSIHKSTSAMFRLVVAGEYSIVMPALFHDVVREKEIGSPIDFARGAGPVVSPQQAAIYAKAPHPMAAKLFAEWLISPEGQAAIDAVGRPSARKGFKSKTSMENGWGPNVKPIVVSNKAYIEDARKWLDTAVKPVWEN